MGDSRRLAGRMMRAGMVLAMGLAACGLLSGCLVAGYSSRSGFFLWPGSLGLLVIVVIVMAMMRRR
jgi:hypothetical protein